MGFVAEQRGRTDSAALEVRRDLDFLAAEEHMGFPVGEHSSAAHTAAAAVVAPAAAEATELVWLNCLTLD
ncbi:hypothetical protein ABEP38_12345 [Cutibacterium acnes]